MPSVAVEFKGVGLEVLARGTVGLENELGRGRGRRGDMGVELEAGGWIDFAIPEDGSVPFS